MAINIHKILSDTLLELNKTKKLQAITVQNILNESGVSRQAFYNRFQGQVRPDTVDLCAQRPVRIFWPAILITPTISTPSTFTGHKQAPQLSETGLSAGWPELSEGLHI